MSKPSFISRHFANTKGGFTLIELLVVIAIIGILSSIVLSSLNTARQKGRDARRISDIKQLQLALELYYDACSTYPSVLTAGSGTGCNNGIVSNGFISQMLTDPSSNTAYSYSGLQGAGLTAATCASYHLGATLESTGNLALVNDFDATTLGTYGVAQQDGGLCTGAAADFAGGGSGCVAGATGIDTCYDVRP